MTLHPAIKNLISWYDKNARELPWRNTRDPYKIWLSEVILQQTRVNQGLPYYLNFLKKFPDLKSLSQASENEVLRQWQGLGYYSRARNIHKCAKYITTHNDGRFPDKFDDLVELPGIGPYTAAAIAAFAFKQPVAAIDGNALRVFTRFFGVREDISKAATVNKIRKEANRIIPADHPDKFNQAIMELGATICLPGNPDCPHCPLLSSCFAFEKKIQNNLPQKSSRQKVRNRYFNYFLFQKGEMIAMFERKGIDIWKGLYDFYLIESDSLLEPTEITDPQVLEFILTGAQIEIRAPKIRHILSHQVIFTRIFEVTIPDNLLKESSFKSLPMNFYSKKEVLDLPKPVLVNNFLKDYFR